MTAPKKIKELEQEISGLNFLLLEQKDHINALGGERDTYKRMLELLVAQCSIPDVTANILEANLNKYK